MAQGLQHQLSSLARSSCKGQDQTIFCQNKRALSAVGLISKRKRGRLSQITVSARTDGDGEVQDSLVDILRLEIGKKKVDEFVEIENDKLKQTAEEVKEEIERLGELRSQQRDQAFDAALENVNRSADEFEAELLKSRLKMEADEAEFSEWEQQVARDRSEGQFFKSLYQVDPKRPVGSIPKTKAPRLVPQGVERVLESPVRGYLYIALAVILLGGAAADLLGDSPSLGPDALYVSVGLLMSWSAWNERKVLAGNPPPGPDSK